VLKYAGIIGGSLITEVGPSFACEWQLGSGQVEMSWAFSMIVTF